MMRGGPQGAHPQSGAGVAGDDSSHNVQSLKQILTLNDNNNNQVTSTPLAANLPIEEVADVYKVRIFIINHLEGSNN